jgi:hypothetical protein
LVKGLFTVDDAASHWSTEQIIHFLGHLRIVATASITLTQHATATFFIVETSRINRSG